MSDKNGRYKHSAHITPKRLKNECANAARFALTLATAAAMLAVIVVPMFSPNTMAAAISNGIQPMLIIIRVSAMVALDDCSTNVSSVPMTKKMSIDPNPKPVQRVMNERISGFWLKSGTEFFISDKPKNNSEKPTMHSPMCLCCSRLAMLSTKPTAISGTARMEMSILKPSNEMSHAVTVVPMLAPMMTPMAWPSANRPALTKPTTITVVALDDWMMAVMVKPVSTLVNRLEVMADKKCRRRLPAAFCRPELIRFMP